VNIRELKEHGPGVMPVFFVVLPLPIQSAASYGHSAPHAVVPVVVMMSRN